MSREEGFHGPKAWGQPPPPPEGPWSAVKPIGFDRDNDRPRIEIVQPLGWKPKEEHDAAQ